jgi:hypothetical protein
MGIGYQFTDRSTIDYELWYLEGLKMPLRGPRTVFNLKQKYWAFAGAAQTFGRFTPIPFPMLISNWFSVPHLNFGFAGAGPEYFVRQASVIEKINASERCFLQVMSGRSTSTGLLKAIGFGGVLQFTRGALQGQRFLAADAYRKLLTHYGRDSLDQQVQEARQTWVLAYEELLSRIRVPVVCVWINLEEDDGQSTQNSVLGGFPHLITAEELSIFDKTGVDVVPIHLRESPRQLLLDFTTRRPVEVFDAAQFPTRPAWSRAINTYYPTPNMHEVIGREVIAYLQRKGVVPDRKPTGAD